MDGIVETERKLLLNTWHKMPGPRYGWDRGSPSFCFLFCLLEYSQKGIILVTTLLRRRKIPSNDFRDGFLHHANEHMKLKSHCVCGLTIKSFGIMRHKVILASSTKILQRPLGFPLGHLSNFCHAISIFHHCC